MYQKIIKSSKKGHRKTTFPFSIQSNSLRYSRPDYLIPIEESNYSEAYMHLSQDRMIFLTEDITKDLASTLCGLLIYYNGVSTTDDIHLFINTSGGDSAALSSIYDVMSLVEAPIATIGLGKIYSAGAFILAAGTKGKRSMLKNAEVLIHGLQCSFPESPLSDQIDSEIYFKYLEDLNQRILRILAKHTDQTFEKIAGDSKRDLYLTAKEAQQYGLIDQILG